MYQRKTKNAEELSEACSRAAHMRHICRGGRPRVDDLPEASLKVYRRDAEVFRRYARMRGTTVKSVLNLLARALVKGASIPSRPPLAPSDWRFFGG